jgi:hypothetical protein
VPLPPDTPRALADALEHALAPDPADRPTAEAFGLAVFDSGPAEPVGFDGSASGAAEPAPGAAVAVPPTHQAAARGRSHEPADVPVPRTRRRRSPSRRGRLVVGAAAAALVLGLAVTAGVAWSAADDVPPAAGRSDGGRPAAGAPPSGWAGTLAGLDADRSRAFADGDPERLRTVYAPGAPALSRDAAALRRLSGAGLRAQGLRLAATKVDLAGRSDGRVRLAVTDVMPAYRLVDEGGAVVERRPGRGARSWMVVLARDGERWRVYDVARG